MRSRDDHYNAVAEQATLAESGGLASERAVLLLWFLRNVIGIGELEAYDHVCDGDRDHGIDGLFVEQGASEDTANTLVIFQSKYTESSGSKIGPIDIDRLAGSADSFTNATTLQNLLQSGIEPSLRELIELLSLTKILADSNATLKIRLVFVTTGILNGEAKKRVDNLRERYGDSYIDVWDVDRLGPVAISVKNPERIQADVTIQIAPRPLTTGEPPNRVAVLPVRATEVVQWPGIEDRQLFALNVRHELRSNRVSKALDDAIRRTADHADFLSYHNGLTVICDEFQEHDDVLIIRNPSVVNGAQSILAFRRGAQQSQLSDELRVFMKVIEVKDRPLLEKEVGRRSNTQTGVTSRNLMANHGTQLRLEREFREQYPNVTYETRPDTLASDTLHVIKNDNAAQLLCAIFNERPWLAIKKNVLFDAENHPQIFSDRIHACHVRFADRIRQAVDNQKQSVPNAYRETWLLTRLVACYLTAQVLRESNMITNLSTASAGDLEDSDLLSALDGFAYVAAVTLAERSEEQGETDQFKKDFKNEQALRALAIQARKTYKLSRRFST